MSALARSPLSNASIARLASEVIRAEGAMPEAVSIALVGPARMRSLNREYLGKDTPTDVIAFALTVDRLTARPFDRLTARPFDRLAGDIYICPAVAARHAKEHGVSAKDELRRLVVHGVLHVLGYDHPAGERRTASPMWKRQERHLARLTR